MSKIFDANSMKEMLREYWKRCVGLATGWLNKYRTDPFFRTEVNVVLLQVAFALVILGLVGTSFSLLYHDVSVAIIEGIRASLASDAPGSLGPAIVQEIEQIRTQNLVIIISVITLTTVLFGYIIARITLAPARAALSSQKQFIGNIAHELRTPLSIIKMNTEVALLDSDMTRDLRETLVSNVEELDRISSIINNLLSLSALVHPEQMKFASVDISALVKEVVNKYAQLAERNEHKVMLETNKDARVWGNATALTQIVDNILKNAIFYTPKGGKVTISVTPDSGNMTQITVQDSGVGIERKDLLRIFEPFYRAEPSRTRGRGLSAKTTGSGLGLTIVSELIKLHRGKITIRSTVGEGTSVSVLLPGGREHAGNGETHTSGSSDEVAVDFSAR